MNFFGQYRWVVLLFALILAACSGQPPQADQNNEPVRYTIEMSEYAFTPPAIQAKVGQEVTLELINTGVLEHELMIGQEVKMTNSRPDGYQHEMFEAAKLEPVVMGGKAGDDDMGHGHGGEHTGFMVTVPMGAEKATVTFRVTEDMLGEWELGCFSQQGVHYDAGMKGTFIVTK